MSRVLLVIPSVLKRGLEPEVAADRHPTMDYCALAETLRSRGARVEMLDYAGVDGMQLPPDLALAWRAFQRRDEFDAVFTNGENVSLPLAVLLKGAAHRPRHVTIGHRLSSGKKRVLIKTIKAHRQIDRIFVYSSCQRRYAECELGIPADVLRLIPFHADTRFYRPLAPGAFNGPLICAAGLEWRDYDTLIAAASKMPDATFRLAAASPWSKHRNTTAQRTLPGNVTARRYAYNELRELYASSMMVAAPLLENDFQAGVTTILEAMAMAKPVIATRTQGQTDVIVDGETGIYVPPADPDAFFEAIRRLREDPNLRRRLGDNARAWVEQNATLDRWASTVAGAILGEAA